jgi:hypothetical protein
VLGREDSWYKKYKKKKKKKKRIQHIRWQIRKPLKKTQVICHCVETINAAIHATWTKTCLKMYSEILLHQP